MDRRDKRSGSGIGRPVSYKLATQNAYSNDFSPYKWSALHNLVAYFTRAAEHRAVRRAIEKGVRILIF